MTYAEFNEAINQLNAAMADLENLYIENGGEVTEDTEDLETLISLLTGMINKEGLDFLGAWLKGKEDKKKALKAEKDYITRQIEANDRSIEFIKSRIGFVMDIQGVEKTEKSLRGYQFTRTISETTAVDKAVLDILYKEKILGILSDNGIPPYVKVSLSGSSQAYQIAVDNHAVPEGDEAIFSLCVKPTVRFTKPKASKEE